MVECLSCGGRYEPLQADGTLYFHRCPPLSLPELKAAIDSGRVKLPKGETPEDAIERRVYERVDRRDENRATTREADADTPAREGRGTREVDDAADVDARPVDVAAVDAPS
jgi:hypothetical protein